MKRTIAILLACLMLVGALAACTKAPVVDVVTDTEPVDETIELTVWESDAGPDEFIRQAGAAFTEKYPNITIKYVHVEHGDAAGQIALDGPGGVGPDLFSAPHDKAGELISGGHVLPVNAALSNIKESCIQGATYDGKLYAFPTAAETYGLFYNKDLIENPPKTWDEVVDFCKGFNGKDKYGFVFDVSNAYYGILFTTANGNQLFGPTGMDTTDSRMNNEASVAGMQLFQSLRKILDVPAADMNTSMAEGLFFEGKAAIFVTGPWNIKNALDAGVNLGVAPLPALPGDSHPAGSFSGVRCMFVSAYTNHPEEAKLFGEFLTSDEMQKLRYDITGAIPSAKISIDSEYLAGLNEQLLYAYPMPSIPEMGKYWDSMGAAMARIWDGEDVQTQLDDVNAYIVGLGE